MIIELIAAIINLIGSFVIYFYSPKESSNTYIYLRVELPNPTNEKIYFKSRISEIGKIDVELLSSLGQVVLKQKNLYIQDGGSIDVSELSPGIYFANLKYNTKTLVKKIIVTK